MDKNFEKVAILSEGEYVWFFGQDDRLRNNVVDYIFSILHRRLDIGIFYLNYCYFDHNMSKVIVPDYLETISKKKSKRINDNSDLFFRNSGDFFEKYLELPNFLPALIMKRSFWNGLHLEDFYGTAYIQVTDQYLNLKKCSIYVVQKILIEGRIPNNSWQENGNKLFEIMSGYLKMQKIVNENKLDYTITNILQY